MATKNEQMVALVINYTEYIIPVDAAHTIQKAMLQAKQEDSFYYGTISVPILQRPTVTVKILDPNAHRFDVSSLPESAIRAWRDMVKDAVAADPSITLADIMDPAQFAKVRGV